MRVETIVRPPLPPRPKTMINARAFEPLPEAAWAALRADLAPLLPLGRGNRRQRGEARSWEEAAADFTRRGRAYLKLLPPWEELHLASRLPWGTPDPPLVTVWGRLGEWVPAPAAQAVADQFIGRPGWDLVEVCTYTRTFSLLEPWPDGFPVRFGVAPAWGTWYGPALVAQLGPERVAGIPAAIVAPRAGGWWVQLTADPADPAGQPGGAVAEAVRAYWGRSGTMRSPRNPRRSRWIGSPRRRSGRRRPPWRLYPRSWRRCWRRRGRPIGHWVGRSRGRSGR
ncbi:protein of unknown function [Candidatus Hydrogenisulfobacillus filiaventi]|uniref:Uncharacterized protein n=1 Tax=Candidatus Hydrogenisulfobacillus filiaventi TaxID=2707344 RepID=A0A6F8ZJP4_9FIRM|nr:protein of unknown function [Candidatus Hydrogenisulfobacillus filiaventi]